MGIQNGWAPNSALWHSPVIPALRRLKWGSCSGQSQAHNDTLEKNLWKFMPRRPEVNLVWQNACLPRRPDTNRLLWVSPPIPALGSWKRVRSSRSPGSIWTARVPVFKENLCQGIFFHFMNVWCMCVCVHVNAQKHHACRNRQPLGSWVPPSILVWNRVSLLFAAHLTMELNARCHTQLSVGSEYSHLHILSTQPVPQPNPYFDHILLSISAITY